MGEQEGDACMIDEKTRRSLNIAGELLGVDADALEKSMVSKTMAVRDQEQKYWYSKAQQEVFPDSGVQMKRVLCFRAALCNARVDSDRARRRIRLATHKLRSPSDGKTPREKLGGVPSIVLSFTDLDLQRFPGTTTRKFRETSGGPLHVTDGNRGCNGCLLSQFPRKI